MNDSAKAIQNRYADAGVQQPRDHADRQVDRFFEHFLHVLRLLVAEAQQVAQQALGLAVGGQALEISDRNRATEGSRNEDHIFGRRGRAGRSP